ncbi:MAG: NADH-quinone oxidoreductase subunit NuoK [Aquificota bacterium]|nr:MAG: NADH-quinone oxidoreductase subunit NuoK [Aquificota bacterium]RLD99195.1 MAG: NADH-quinone oxidoreductase subunit NuoK [Aquificota bacterium]RLD99338.1 MAG: NADH-quinone oxidoreductase subunit NuoK [Aquificota bacterium]
MIPLNHVIIFSLIIFIIGMVGALSRRNVFIILMSIELMLNAVNIALIGISSAMGDLVGQILAIFIITVAAGEAAVGLAIVVALYRNRLTVNVDAINLLKW